MSPGMTLTAHAAIDAFLANETTCPAALPVETPSAAASTTSGSTVNGKDVARHMELVHRVVARFMRRVPANVDRGDLVSAGMFGLMSSLEKNGGDTGEAFQGYALMRIRGAILDELRSQDWLSRRARRALVAGGAEYVGPAALVGIDDVGEGEQAASLMDRSTPDALATLEALGTQAELQGAVAQLPEREQMIVAKHYFEGVPFKTLAATLKVSEPRVSQLHTRALGRLREILADVAA